MVLDFKKFEKQKGFSLVELVVVLVLFLIIGGVTVDVFISVVKNQKRILEEQELLNQVSFVSEYMSKALRSAMRDPDGSCLGIPEAVYVLTHCPNGTLQACNGVKFINSSDNNACQEFFLDESVNLLNPPLREIKNNFPPQNLLSDKFMMKYGRFIINGDETLHLATTADSQKPRITFLLDVLTASNQSEKIIQSTISQQTSNKSTPQNSLSCNGFSQCVLGGGGASCNSNADCVNLSCNGLNQCVQSGGGVSCISSIDCGAPLP